MEGNSGSIKHPAFVANLIKNHRGFLCNVTLVSAATTRPGASSLAFVKKITHSFECQQINSNSGVDLKIVQTVERACAVPPTEYQEMVVSNRCERVPIAHTWAASLGHRPPPLKQPAVQRN